MNLVSYFQTGHLLSSVHLNLFLPVDKSKRDSQKIAVPRHDCNHDLFMIIVREIIDD